MTEKRFTVNNGKILEYNYLIDAWHEADLKKICDLLNDFDDISYKVLENKWKNKKVIWNG